MIIIIIDLWLDNHHVGFQCFVCRRRDQLQTNYCFNTYFVTLWKDFALVKLFWLYYALYRQFSKHWASIIKILYITILYDALFKPV